MWNGDTDTFKSNRICAGSSMSDVKDFTTFKDKKSLYDAYKKSTGTSDTKIAQAYWQLIDEVTPGDYIVVFQNQIVDGRNNHLIYGYGTVVEGFSNDDTSDNPIHIGVEWNETIFDPPIEDSSVRNSMFFHSTNEDQANTITTLLGIVGHTKSANTYTSTMNKTTRECVDLLLSNLNLILTGAPGTGKTYLSKQIAAQIIAGRDWDQLTPAQKKQAKNVQFHPSYDYTDFVEGLRPEKPAPGSTDIIFSRQDGVFKAFCADAIRTSSPVTSAPTVVSATAPVSVSSAASFSSILNQLKSKIGTAMTAGSPLMFTKVGHVELDATNRIIYVRPGKSGKPDDVRRTQEKYLKYAFDYYIANGNLGLTGVSGKELEAVIAGMPGGPNTIIRSEYMWALKQLLALYQKTASAGTPAIIPTAGSATNTETETNGHDITIPEQAQKPKYVFIIDEINRGELSKIFGELFSVIEPDYRNEENRISTQYQNLVESGDIFEKGFYVPDNVYIIGTMNDVDRGVESIDFAIRRRFAWKEVTAEESAVNMGIKGLALKKMEAVNDALIDEKLTSAYKIGGSFFRKFNSDTADFEKLWTNHLRGVIFEYFRGEPEAEKILNRIYKKYKDAAVPVAVAASASASPTGTTVSAAAETSSENSSVSMSNAAGEEPTTAQDGQ